MTHFAIFLNGPVQNDSRVIKTIRSLAAIGIPVDLYYLFPGGNDHELFPEKVSLIGMSPKRSLSQKFLSRTWFTHEHMELKNECLKSGKKYTHIWANDLPCLVPAIKAGQQVGARVIYDSHEIFIETINQFFPKNAFILKKAFHRINAWLMKAIGKKVERKYLCRADLVITVNESLKQHFLNEYGKKDILVLRNTPVPQDITPVDLHSKFDISPSKRIIIYQGGLNAGRGLMRLIEAMEYIKSEFFLLVFGDGYIKPDLVERVNSLNLTEHVIFAGFIDNKHLLHHTAGGDVGVCLLEATNKSKELALPNKIFEYVYAGIPVIASNMPETRRILEEFPIGVLTRNEPAEIAESIRKVASSQSRPGKKLLESFKARYNWDSEFHKVKLALDL